MISGDAVIIPFVRGVAQLVRALFWGDRSREFESRHSDDYKQMELTADFIGCRLFFDSYFFSYI